MRFRWPSVWMAIALGGLMFTSCARHGAPVYQPAGGSGAAGTNSAPTPRKWIVTPEEGVDGKVAWVNPNLRFVVVTFPIGRTPGMDHLLNVYHEGLKVGEVKITGPQREDSTVGDIITGEAAPGDTVRER